jgi:hypothetical protein
LAAINSKYDFQLRISDAIEQSDRIKHHAVKNVSNFLLLQVPEFLRLHFRQIANQQIKSIISPYRQTLAPEFPTLKFAMNLRPKIFLNSQCPQQSKYISQILPNPSRQRPRSPQSRAMMSRTCARKFSSAVNARSLNIARKFPCIVDVRSSLKIACKVVH